MNELDRRILAALQSGFPVCERPFAPLAERLGLTEEALIGRLARLLEQGVIRRFGPVFDSRRLGFASTLVAARIPDPDDLPRIAAAIGAYHEVTHNYQRSDQLNLWFTLIAENRERIGEILRRVAALPGVAELHELPAEEVYKLRTSFEPRDEAAGGGRDE